MSKSLILSLLLVFSLEAKSFFSNKEQANNAVYINELKNLIISTQKTRGLTNSYLNGNVNALLLIELNKKKIKRAIGNLESFPISDSENIASRVTTISQNIFKINRKAFEQEADQTFKDYTYQIEEILMLSQSISKRGSSNLNKFGKDAISLMMETILPLIEEIGKLRGMGSGVIAAEEISKNKRLLIVSILTEIDELNSELNSKSLKLLSNHKSYYPFSLESSLNQLNESIEDYILLTNKEVLNVSECETCNPTSYFENGTDIIDLLLNIFKVNKKAILTDSDGWF